MSHDDRIRQLSDLFIEDLRTPIEASLRQILGQLMGIAAQEQASAIDDAVRRADCEHQASATAAVEFAAQQRDMALEALEADLLQRHTGALDALQAEHEEALQALRAQLEQEHDAVLVSLVGQAVADGEARLEAVQQEHEAALVRLVGQAVDDGEARLQAAQEELEAARRERDAARASVAELTDQLAVARAQHEQLTELAHAESAAAEQMSANSVEAHAQERQFELECSERLLAAMRQLDESRTLTEILTILADHSATLASRVAVLLVQAGQVRGWRFVGMGDVEAGRTEIPLDRAGFLGRVVETGLPVPSTEATDVRGDLLPAFLATPRDRAGLALPVVVGGRVVAILYADDAGQEARVVPSNWPEVAEVLARHAGRCLEVLTLSRANGASNRTAQDARPEPPRAAPLPAAAPARESDEAREEESARRHARLLISEIKLYNETLVEQGRREGNLLGLLGTEIERARRLYEEKIPAAVRQRVDCFDEEIVRTLAGGDPALLGQVT